jgi:hypothetical protein
MAARGSFVTDVAVTQVCMRRCTCTASSPDTCYTAHSKSSKHNMVKFSYGCSCNMLKPTRMHASNCSNLGWPHLRMAWPCHSCLNAGRPLSMLCMLLPRTHSPMGVWEHGSPPPGTCSAAHCYHHVSHPATAAANMSHTADVGTLPAGTSSYQQHGKSWFCANQGGHCRHFLQCSCSQRM